jgi:hypothetical protein
VVGGCNCVRFYLETLMDVDKRRLVGEFLPVQAWEYYEMSRFANSVTSRSPSPAYRRRERTCAMSIGKVSSSGQYIHIRGGVQMRTLDY